MGSSAPSRSHRVETNDHEEAKMAIDTFMAYVGAYDSVGAAQADYEA